MGGRRAEEEEEGELFVFWVREETGQEGAKGIKKQVR